MLNKIRGLTDTIRWPVQDKQYPISDSQLPLCVIHPIYQLGDLMIRKFAEKIFNTVLLCQQIFQLFYSQAMYLSEKYYIACFGQYIVTKPLFILFKSK